MQFFGPWRIFGTGRKFLIITLVITVRLRFIYNFKIYLQCIFKYSINISMIDEYFISICFVHMVHYYLSAPYSQVQSKTVFKSWILFAAVKSAENRFLNSWATSYSVCRVKRLSSGPLADMPFGSNQMNRSQTRPGLKLTQENKIRNMS